MTLRNWAKKLVVGTSDGFVTGSDRCDSIQVHTPRIV